MKTDSEEIDKLIKQSLNEKEAEFYDSLDEQSLFGMMGGLYKGPMSWILVVMTIVNVIAFGVAIYCAIKFFGTDQTNELIKYGIGFLTMILMTSFVKTYSWMHLNRQAITRELKRIEFQISILSSKGL
ncbi:MAG: DUF6768 family protein [Gilvibacter sp.]